MSNNLTVTSENLDAFNASRIPALQPDAPPPDPVVDEAVQGDGVKAETETEKKEDAKEEPPKRSKLENRFSEITAARNAANERAERAERELAELRAKAAPKQEEPKPEGGKPQAKDFEDAFEYAEKLAEWSANDALTRRDREEAEKVQAKERETVQKAWIGRVDAIKAEYPDFDDMLASSKVGVHNATRDAIIESEHGPRILYEIASDDALAAQIAAMTPAKQLLWMGRMEAGFEKAQAPKDEPKETPKRKPPPEPITAVVGRGASDDHIDGKGEFNGTASQYRQLRRAGRI